MLIKDILVYGRNGLITEQLLNTLLDAMYSSEESYLIKQDEASLHASKRLLDCIALSSERKLKSLFDNHLVVLHFLSNHAMERWVIGKTTCGFINKNLSF